MEIDNWINGYKIRAFPWIDGKCIHFNVQFYKPGQSLSKPPEWDKSIFIYDDTNGRRLVYEFTSTLAEYVAHINIPYGFELNITAEKIPEL